MHHKIDDLMKALLPILSCLASAAAMMVVAGCARATPTGSLGSLSPPIGKTCTIQFRRDALGAGSELPISPMTSNVNGAETAITGTLQSANDQWIVLTASGKEIWVPRAVILLVQF